MFRCGGEIIEHILFVCQIAGPMPLFAVLAATSQIGHGIDDAMVQQHSKACREGWRLTHAEASITVENRRIVAIEPGPLSLDDVHRNLGAIF
jgi:hypothetical protein